MNRYPNWLVISFLFAVGTAGALAVWKSTPHGLGFYSDSEIYIQTARNFSRGHGLTMPTLNGGYAYEGFFPPGFALLLSVGHWFNMDPFAWSRCLNALFFAASIVLIGWIVWLCTKRVSLSFLSSLATAGSVDLLEVHHMVWSEPVFIFFATAGIYLLWLFLENPTLLTLLAAGFVTAYAFLTRYAGIAWIVAGGLAILSEHSRKLKRNLFDAVLYGLFCVSMMIPWKFIIHKSESGFEGRVLVIHSKAFMENIPTGIQTMVGWVTQDLAPTGALSIKILSLAAIFIFMGYITLSRKNDRLTSLIRLLWYSIICYVGLLALTITFFDASTPLDLRLLAPLHVTLLILLAILTNSVLPPGHRKFNGLTGMLLLLCIGWFSHRSILWMREAESYGEGFTNSVWSQSDLVNEIKRLDPKIQLYSNVPYPIIVYADRACALPPVRVNVNTLQINPAFETQIQGLRLKMQKRDAVLAYFNHMDDNDDGIPSLSDLRSFLHLRLLKKTADGNLFVSD